MIFCEEMDSERCCPVCEGTKLDRKHVYTERPNGETRFDLGTGYHREIWNCRTCGHYLSIHDMDLSGLYSADYVDSTYGGPNGIRENYAKIMGLDPEKSDNVGRVDRVVEFAQRRFGGREDVRVLDVGAGLGVFLGRLREKVRWNCVAIEPDQRFAEHIEETLGIEAITSDYLDVSWDRKFDLITLNKVLEHVEEPRRMLESCLRDLAPDGVLYLELPDGEAAASDEIDFLREEFFIEHHHIFSMASMEISTTQAGFRSLALQRMQEPSSKYTLVSWLAAAQ